MWIMKFGKRRTRRDMIEAYNLIQYCEGNGSNIAHKMFKISMENKLYTNRLAWTLKKSFFSLRVVNP